MAKTISAKLDEEEKAMLDMIRSTNLTKEELYAFITDGLKLAIKHEQVVLEAQKRLQDNNGMAIREQSIKAKETLIERYKGILEYLEKGE